MSIIRCLEKVVMGLLGLAIVTFIFTVFTGPEKAIDNAFAVKLPYVVAARASASTASARDVHPLPKVFQVSSVKGEI
jgi:hypothetical protein